MSAVESDDEDVDEVVQQRSR